MHHCETPSYGHYINVRSPVLEKRENNALSHEDSQYGHIFLPVVGCVNVVPLHACTAIVQMVTQYLTCPVMCFSMHDRQRWFDLVTTEVLIRFLCPFPKFTHYILPKKRHRLFQKLFGKNVVCIAIQFSLSHVDSKLSKRMSAASDV